MSRDAPPRALSLADGLRRWLSSARPQAPSGAYYAWIDAVTGRPSFAYPEITGYALTHLVGRADPTPAELDRAGAAARWLVERFARGDRSAHQGYDGGTVYSFDLAMIATGLMSAGTVLDAGPVRDLGLHLAADLQAEIERSGRLDSIAPGTAPSSRSAWSTRGRAHLLKAVQSLLWADRLGRPGALDAARTLVRSGSAAQKPDGRFVTHPDDVETMLHPHLYAVEGLWMFAAATGDAEALERAELGTRWALQQQLESGGLPRYVTTRDGGVGPEQLDATAQALRAGTLLNICPARCSSVADRLRELAQGGLAQGDLAQGDLGQGDPAQIGDGGGLVLPYQPGSTHLNVWVTLFAAQASAVVDGHVLGWQNLV